MSCFHLLRNHLEVNGRLAIPHPHWACLRTRTLSYKPTACSWPKQPALDSIRMSSYTAQTQMSPVVPKAFLVCFSNCRSKREFTLHELRTIPHWLWFCLIYLCIFGLHDIVIFERHSPFVLYSYFKINTHLRYKLECEMGERRPLIPAEGAAVAASTTMHWSKLDTRRGHRV